MSTRTVIARVAAGAVLVCLVSCVVMFTVTEPAPLAQPSVQHQLAEMKGRLDHNTEEITELKALRIERHLGVLDEQVSFIVKLLWACLGTAGMTFLAIAGKSLIDRRNQLRMRLTLHQISNVVSRFDLRVEEIERKGVLTEQKLQEVSEVLEWIHTKCKTCPIGAEIEQTVKAKAL